MDSKKMMALLTATGLFFSPMMGLADTYQNVNNIQQENQEDLEIAVHYMKKGENLSLISLDLYGDRAYWIVLAFLNGYPKVGQPGDRIRYFKSFDKMLKVYYFLKDSGWYAKYVTKNNIYKKTANDYNLTDEEVATLLYAIYGDQVCIDPDFIQTYLDMHDNSLTEWIPSLEEIDNYQKTKKR